MRKVTSGQLENAHPNKNNQRVNRSSPFFKPQMYGVESSHRVISNFQKKKNDIRLKNIYKYPSNYKLALYHKNANKVGRTATFNTQSNLKANIKACPCCENIYVIEQFDLCYSTFLKQPEQGEQKNQLPIGISSYFTFIKMIIIFLLLRFLAFDIPTLLFSVYGHYCSNLFAAGKDDLCSFSMSGYNLRSSQDTQKSSILDIISLLFTILSIVYFIIFRKIQHQQKNRSRSLSFSQDNFSLLIQNVPPFLYDDYTQINEVHFNYQQYLKFMIETKISKWIQSILENVNNPDSLNYLQRQFLTDVVNKQNITQTALNEKIVTSVSLCYDLSEMENVFRMRHNLLEEHISDESNIYKQSTTLLKHIPNQIQLLNKEYIRLCENYVGSNEKNKRDSFQLTHFTGKAFISFQYQHYRDYFIRSYQQNKEFFVISGKPITMSLANKPNDVFWYNMKITDEERSKNIRYSWAVLVMLLIISLASLIGIQLWSISQERKFLGYSFQDKLKGYLISALMALLTTTINYLVNFTMELLSTVQKHKTKSDRLSSLMVKTLTTQAINTSFIYVILYIIEPSNPIGSFGLASKIISLVVISSLASLLLNIFIPVQTISALINKCKINENAPINLFQADLNKKIEYPQYQYSVKYAFYIVNSFVIAFYGFLVPFTTIFLIVIFIIHYWVDKYNLLRRFSSPVDFSFQLRDNILSSFELSVFFFAAGYFLWDTSIHFDSSTKFKAVNIINVLIAMIYSGLSIFTSRIFKNKILKNEDEPDVISYFQYMNNPYNRYAAKTFYSENPATTCLRDTSYLKDVEATILMRENEVTRKKRSLQNMHLQIQKMREEQQNSRQKLRIKFLQREETKNILEAIALKKTLKRQQLTQSRLEKKHQNQIKEKEAELQEAARQQQKIKQDLANIQTDADKLNTHLAMLADKIREVQYQMKRYRQSIQKDQQQNRNEKYGSIVHTFGAFEELPRKQIYRGLENMGQIQKELIQQPDPQHMFITEEEIQQFIAPQRFIDIAPRYNLEQAELIKSYSRKQ